MSMANLIATRRRALLVQQLERICTGLAANTMRERVAWSALLATAEQDRIPAYVSG
jgi:hypothetical protein